MLTLKLQQINAVAGYSWIRLLRFGKPLLPPGFIHGHGYSVGKVEAAATFTHGQAQALFGGHAVADVFRQTTAFRAEQEGIAGLVADVVEWLAAFGGEGENPGVADAGQAALQVRMAFECGVLVIIQPGAAQAFIIQFEA